MRPEGSRTGLPRCGEGVEQSVQPGRQSLPVILAWQIGSVLPVVPLAGVSSVAQLEENLAAVELELTGEQRERLDAVG
ncbi:aldo/keto reductase [Streptomyces pseudovenezuelae]|uniref:aldo/keto reductase n=1 Tax=Streptomyces pseudovenezuelae TaxID=67350 RepID=UPI0039A6AF70